MNYDHFKPFVQVWAISNGHKNWKILSKDRNPYATPVIVTGRFLARRYHAFAMIGGADGIYDAIGQFGSLKEILAFLHGYSLAQSLAACKD